MTTFDVRLLPPEEPEQILPEYRSVWRSALYEMIVLVILAAGLQIGLARVHLDAGQRQAVSAVIALAPVGLWLFFTWRREQRVQHPRQRLLTVALLGLVMTAAVVIPVISRIVVPADWLYGASGLTRLIGYSLTVGVVTELIKYLVLRYTVWWEHFERRADAVAYSLTVSLGVATMLNLQFALLDGGAQAGPAAIRIVSVVLSQGAAGLPVAYGLMRMKLRPTVYEPALFLLFGAFLHGFYMMMRAGIAIQGFSARASGNSPVAGLIFSVIFALTFYGLFAFLIASADARDEKVAGLEPGERSL